jgi:hypothetical protein
VLQHVQFVTYGSPLQKKFFPIQGLAPTGGSFFPTGISETVPCNFGYRKAQQVLGIYMYRHVRTLLQEHLYNPIPKFFQPRPMRTRYLCTISYTNPEVVFYL